MFEEKWRSAFCSWLSTVKIGRPGRFIGIARFLVTVPMLIAISSKAYSRADEGDDIAITIQKHLEVVTVDASLFVPVPPPRAWDVLTDYEHMTDFLPQLQTSHVLSRHGDALRVYQEGRVFFGPIPIYFEYLRDVEMEPYRQIRSISVGGSLKRGEVTTRLTEVDGGTRISYHSEAVPGIWIPLGIGESFVRGRLREQFISLRDEMLRREASE